MNKTMRYVNVETIFDGYVSEETGTGERCTQPKSQKASNI